MRRMISEKQDQEQMQSMDGVKQQLQLPASSFPMLSVMLAQCIKVSYIIIITTTIITTMAKTFSKRKSLKGGRSFCLDFTLTVLLRYLFTVK